MKKFLGSVIIAAFFVKPALAGETFVFNQWKVTQGRTETNYNIDSTTNSTWNEEYSSSANKMSFDGKAKTENQQDKTTESFEDFTVHNASSYQNGSFQQEMTNRVWGTINSITNSYTTYHETSAGVR